MTLSRNGHCERAEGERGNPFQLSLPPCLSFLLKCAWKGGKMKIINLKETLYRPGEYLVGAEQTQSHACYFIYGVLKPGEEREFSPGEGHEEIFCLIEGTLTASDPEGNYNLQKGNCFHLKGEEKVTIKNESAKPAIYVMAGGHSDEGHHHHH
jgi:hypothetical protein